MAGPVRGALVTGAGYGMLSLVVNRRFLTEFGSRGAGMVGLVNAVFGLGAIVAPQAFLWAGETPGPVYLALALLFLAVVPLVRPAPWQEGAPTGLPPLHAGRLSILAFVFVAIVIEVGIFGFGPSALLALDLPSARVAGLASGFFAAYLAARLALYWLSASVRPEHLFLAGFVGTALAMTAVVFGAAGAGYVAAGASIGVQFPTFFVWASRVMGDDPRLGSAPLIGALAGGTFGPLLLAPVVGGFGAAALFPTLLVTAAAAGLVLAASLPRIARIAAA